MNVPKGPPPHELGRTPVSVCFSQIPAEDSCVKQYYSHNNIKQDRRLSKVDVNCLRVPTHTPKFPNSTFCPCYRDVIGRRLWEPRPEEDRRNRTVVNPVPDIAQARLELQNR